MPKIEKENTDKAIKDLEKTVKYYVENEDYFTAKSFIKSTGKLIPDYPWDVKLEEINKLEQKVKSKKED